MARTLGLSFYNAGTAGRGSDVHGRLPHNDDMTMRVRSFRKEIGAGASVATKRADVSTTSVSAQEGSRQIAFFFTGRRHMVVAEHRTRRDWAHFIKGMRDERYPEAKKVRLVMDTSTRTAWPRVAKRSSRKRLADRLAG